MKTNNKVNAWIKSFDSEEPQEFFTFLGTSIRKIRSREMRKNLGYMKPILTPEWLLRFSIRIGFALCTWCLTAPVFAQENGTKKEELYPDLGAGQFRNIAREAWENTNSSSIGTLTATKSTRRTHLSPLSRPNLILILTDDLDLGPVGYPGPLSYMPQIQSLLVNQGLTFSNAFVTRGLCCPSRASILRGQYPHNHQIQSNHLPDGGFEKFTELGLDTSTIATWR